MKVCPAWTGDPIVTLETAPAADLISIADAKDHLRVDHDDDDTFIEAAIAVAMDALDGWQGRLRRALINQAWRVAVCQADHYGRLFSPLAPASAFTAIQYYPPNSDTLTTATASEFRLIKGGLDWSYIEPKDGFAWPSTDDRPDALQAVFTCGYGEAAENVPASIIHAAKLLIGHFYENREESTALQLKALPFGVAALIHPHKGSYFA